MGQLGCNDLISLQFLFYNMRLKNMRRLIITFILTGIITILTGCAKGTIEMLETTAPTEQEETTEIPTTTVQDETTEAITEAPTEPPTTWEESIDWATKEEIKAEFDKLQVPESIQKVILDNDNVIVSKKDNGNYGTERAFRDVTAGFYYPTTHIYMFRAVDMNQDGKNELIISVSSKGSFKNGRDVVLRELEDGKVCIYWFDVEVTISNNTGYIQAIDRNFNYYVYKHVFNGYEIKEENVAWIDNGFFIEGKEVTREEYDEFAKINDFSGINYNDWVHLMYYIGKE